MKKLSILFTAFILSSQAFSQLTYSWVKSLTNSTSSDYLIRGIEVSSSGNVYIMGNFNTTTDFDPSSANFYLTPNLNQSCFLAKYTSSGNFIWAKEIIAETVMFGNPDVNDLVIDSNENIYITGSYWETVDFDPSASTYTLCANITYTGSGGGTAHNRFAYTAKYNSTGNFIWAKDIRRSTGYHPGTGGGGEQGGSAKIALDGSDNIYVGGNCGARPYFCKYNSTGTRLWQDSLITTSIGSGHEGYLTGFYVNSAGEVFVGGTFNDNIDMDPSAGVSLLLGSGASGLPNFLGKYSTNGIFIFGKKYMNCSFPSIEDITSDAIGNIYTCGFGSNGGTSSRNLIIKWDNTGNLQWTNYFHGNVLAPIGGCSDIYISCSNNIVVTGFISGLQFPPNNNFDPLGGTYTCSPGPLYGGSCVYIASYSPSNGAILWAKSVGGGIKSPGYTNIDGNPTNSPPLLSNSFIDNFGSVYLYGSLDASISTINDFDPNSGVVTLNPIIDKAFFAKYTGCGAVGIEENNDANNITVSPNPSNDKFIFSNLVGENKIEIMDITGRLILSDKITYSSYTLSMDDLPRGMYFYKITDAKGQLKQGKLLLQ